MFYGVNAAAFLARCEIDARITVEKVRFEKGHVGEVNLSKLATRGSIQQAFIHYLRFIRSLTESDV